MGNKLHLVQEGQGVLPGQQLSARAMREQSARAHFERLWLKGEDELDPKKTAIGQLRIQRSWEFLIEYMPELKGKKIVDLGCGCGDIALMLSQEGAKVKAFDVATNALKKIEEKDASISLIRGCLPHTIFQDGEFDVVIAMDVLAELDPIQHRLLFSELGRLVKKEGYVVCSTPLDFHSEDPIIELIKLAKTEFEILEWRVSSHRALIFWQNVFNIPERLLLCTKDKEYRIKQLKEGSWIKRKLLFCLTLPFLKFFWKLMDGLFYPIKILFLKNRNIAMWMETLSSHIWADNSISHAIFIGRLKPFL